MTVDAYDELETRSSEARSAAHEEALRATLRRCWERSRGNRRRLEGAGLDPNGVRGLEDLAALPVLSKDELFRRQREDPPFGGFLTVKPTELPRIFVSPGPLYDPQQQDDDIGGFARGLYAAGIRSGMLVLNTFAYHLTPAGHAFESAARTIGATVIPGGIGNTEQQVELLQDLGVEGYIGTPSFLSILMERTPTWGFSRAVVAAEKLTEEDRKTFEERGGRVRQIYGTADVGHIAAECESADGMHVTEDKHVEICDPDSGRPVDDEEVGEVVLTTFSAVYPLLRFGTGDLSRWLSAEACPCGRTSPRIAGVLGRVGAGVKVRGMFVYPHHLGAALGELGIAAELVVDREGPRDVLTLRVEDTVAEEDLREVARRLREVAKVRAEVEAVPRAQIEQEGAIRDVRTMWDEVDG
jgi:phenylacetate-CoA ligase